jgi:hypothetical protein
MLLAVEPMCTRSRRARASRYSSLKVTQRRHFDSIPTDLAAPSRLDVAFLIHR